jgi:cyclopropane fatty-acyl-phospholipid synthase-like methyltransferase
MSWEMVVDFFQGVGKMLNPGGMFILYGPFNYNGEYTSQSNANFDLWLKDRDPNSAIRDFEALNKLATEAELILVNDYEMPANNRILYWKKIS